MWQFEAISALNNIDLNEILYKRILKGKRAKITHGWKKQEKINMDWLWLEIHRADFLTDYFCLYKNVIYNARELFLFVILL